MITKLQAKFIGSLLSFLTLFLFTICNAQVSNYQFFQLSGTYTPITGGTLINDGILSQSRQFDDDEIENIPLGFTFNYNGSSFTTVNLSSNGFLTFNPIVTTYSPISSSAPNRVISAMGADLASGVNIMGNTIQASNLITNVASINGLSVGQAISQTGNNVFLPGTTITAISGSGPFTLTMSAEANANASDEIIEFNFDSQVPGENPSELRYQTIGTAPNRTFVAQYTRLTRYGFFYDNLNFQIRLNENGSIEFVYGDFSWNSSLQNTAQVGIKGNTNNDFNNRRGTNWNATTPGTTRTSFVVAGSNNIPPLSGTTFRWALCTSAEIVVTPATDTLCAGQSSLLTASGAVSYTWAPEAGLNTSTGANVIASPTTSTTYTVLGSDANGCVNTATVSVLISGGPSISVNDATICSGNNAVLTVTPSNLNYNWSNGESTSSINVSPSSTSIFTVTVTDLNGCSVSAVGTVTVDTTTLSNTEVAVCNNQLPYNWNGNDYNAAGSYEVTLSGANGCDSIATLILTVNNTGSSTTDVAVCNNQLPYNWNGNDYNAAGSYEVTLSGANGCDSIATLILSVNTPPVLTSISGSTSVCPATASTYSINQVDGATYNWTYSSNWLTNSGVSTNTINVTVVDTSFLTVTATNSCGTSNPVTIFVNSQCPLPTGVGTTSVNSTSATISWNSASCSQQYTVQIKQVGTGIWTSFDAGANTTYTFTGLNPLKNYQYKVINICSTLPGTPILYGPVYSFSTPAANGCTLPQNLAVTNISASSAKINWNTQTAFRFRLRVRPVGTTTWTSYTITGSQHSIILTNLNSSTEYEYQMRTECSLGVFSGFTGRKKFTTLAGRLDETEDHTGYNLYPNPVLDRLNIAAPFSDDTYYDVYISNTLGQVMLTLQELRGSNQSVDLTSLPAGVYIVNIKEAEEIRSYKIVKQ
ncbi:MAG: fibronectin type III domain-containing protein [Bacteroidota bacterium]